MASKETMISGDLDTTAPSPQLPSFFASKTWKQAPAIDPIFVNTNPSTPLHIDGISALPSDTVQEPFIEGAKNKSKSKSKSKSKPTAKSTPKPPPPPPPPTPTRVTSVHTSATSTTKSTPSTTPSASSATPLAPSPPVDTIPKNPQQVIIETVTDEPPQPRATPKKTQVEIAIDAITGYLSSMNKPGGKKFNFDKMYLLLAKAVMFLPNMFDLILNLLSAWYLERVNHIHQRELGDEHGKEYIEYLERVKKQVKQFFYLLTSLYMVLNWWYGFNYFHRFISTSHLVDVGMIPPLKIVLESNMAFTNLVNYLLFGFKQDEERVPVSADICAFLWKYRPFVFVTFMTIFQSIYVNQKATIEKEFFDAMTRKTNGIAGANIFFTFMSWIKLDLLWPDRMKDRMMIFQNFFITFFVVLLKLLLILAFLPLGVTFLYLFLFFWSYFPLAVFNGPSMFTMIKVMLIDLANSVDETSTENPGQKLYRIVVNQLVPITIFVMFFSVLLSNITALSGLAKNQSTTTLLGVSMLVFAIFLGFMGKYGYDVISNVWSSMQTSE